MAYPALQSFEETADPSHGGKRLAALRDELQRRGLDCFIVPRADDFQNEYVPPCAERLAWLTGFTGSAGTAIVLADAAAVFVDGRYTLQVRDQVDVKSFAPVDSGTQSPSAWLEAHAPRETRIGYDPWLLTPAQVARFETAAKTAGAVLVPVDSNPIDAVWTDRPPAPAGQVALYPPKFAGRTAKQKLSDLRKDMKGYDALLVSDPHAVAWLLNIRGSDVAHTPLVLSRALVAREGDAMLFVDAGKVSPRIAASLAKLISIEPPEALIARIETLAKDGRSLRFDSASVPARLVQAYEFAGGTADVGADPITLMKARKTAAELDGARAAHLRDGVAMVRFLAWFDAQAPKGKLTEISAAQKLETFRHETGLLKDLSFPSISGFGPNGAIVHYRVTEKTNCAIGKGIYLIDSGAQYEDGTTDITRTLCVGAPTKEMRDRYTRVLKGHIGIATSLFPKGTSGAQLDGFARRSLWEAGLDFDHGTGHGVGAYLSVHEGPQRISKISSVALEPGMILSNEPGYYKTGAYGIRIENLVVVEPRVVPASEREMFGFETLTLAPYDLRLIEPKLMSPQELAWLNAYHARVRKALSSQLDASTKRWLAQATKAVR
jgi:Xaa-Pro aminopeptidase